MSVNPGFGGQQFIENSYRKIEELAEMRERLNSELLIEVDGGVTLENAPQLINAGADVLVAGNAVFADGNAVVRIEEFKRL
jgi:ribulose-phosphate 3-epimerase